MKKNRLYYFPVILILALSFLSFALAQVDLVTTVSFSKSSIAAKAYMESSFMLTVTDVDGRPMDVFFQDVSNIGFVFTGNPDSFTDVSSGRTLLQTVEVPPAAYPGQHVILAGAVPSALVADLKTANGGTMPAVAAFPEYGYGIDDITLDVNGINYAPTIELLAEQDDNTNGTVSDPFHSGEVLLRINIVSDEGYIASYMPRWNYSKVSGSFCSSSSSLHLYAGNGLSGQLVVPPVKNRVGVKIEATIVDGLHSVTTTRIIYVDPSVDGCDGGTTPVGEVTATASASSVGFGDAIALAGRLGGAMTGGVPAWYLGSATTGSTPVCSAWNCTVYAPYSPTTLYYTFRVYDSVSGASLGEDGVTVTVNETSSVGNTCNCTGQEEPMTVDAGPTTMQVVGGNTLQLSGSADNPNVPDNLYTVTPTYSWSIIDYGGLAQASVTLSSANTSKPTLTTPVVTANTTIKIRLEAEEWGCDCWDDVTVTILPEGSSTKSASIIYAIGSDTPVLAGSTVAKSVSGSTAQLSLQASQVGFTSPIYQWSATKGSITSPTSASATLSLTNISTSGTQVTVTLKVSESGNASTYETSSTVFTLTDTSGSGGDDDLTLQYTLNGVTKSAGNNAVQIETLSASTLEMELSGVASGYTSPQFSWKTGSNAKLSAKTGETTTLSISTFSDEIWVPVYLTVTESGAANTDNIVVFFGFMGSSEVGQPSNVSISVMPGEEVEPGMLVKATANAVSATSLTADQLSYEWDINSSDGQSIDFYPNGRLVMFYVPLLEEGDTIDVHVTVKEGASLPAEDEVTLNVSMPTLMFAHFASGPTAKENLLMELLLLNSTDNDCEGSLMQFFDEDGYPLEVEVDGVVESEHEFSLQAGSAVKMQIRNPDIENSIIVGWVKIKSQVQLTGALQYRYMDRSTDSLVAAASLASSEEGRKFTVALDQGRNVDMGIALANPNSFEVNIEFVVNNPGSESEGEPATAGEFDQITLTKTLPAKGQLVGFIPELLTIWGEPLLNDTFTGGTLVIRVPVDQNGSIVATVLRQSDGLLTTEPLAVNE